MQRAARGLGVAMAQMHDTGAEHRILAARRRAHDQDGAVVGRQAMESVLGGLLGGLVPREGADLHRPLGPRLRQALIGAGGGLGLADRRERGDRAAGAMGDRLGSRGFGGVGDLGQSPAECAKPSLSSTAILASRAGADVPPITTAMSRRPSRTAEAARLKPDAWI